MLVLGGRLRLVGLCMCNSPFFSCVIPSPFFMAANHTQSYLFILNTHVKRVKFVISTINIKMKKDIPLPIA